VKQARLAEPGRSLDEDDAPAALVRQGEGLAELR
jgi:hypothetical protein